MKWTLAIILSFWSCATLAEAKEQPQQDAFIKVNMTLELDGIEKAIQETRQSLDLVGKALNDIAHNDSFNPEQQQLLADTVDNLNQLVVLSKQSVANMPSAFEQSRQAIATESQRFLDDLRFQVLLIVGAIGAVIVAIIGAIAWFVLRPMQNSLVHATQNLSSMAGAIKTTAEALDSISNQQDELAKRLAEQNGQQQVTEHNDQSKGA